MECKQNGNAVPDNANSKINLITAIKKVALSISFRNLKKK